MPTLTLKKARQRSKISLAPSFALLGVFASSLVWAYSAKEDVSCPPKKGTGRDWAFCGRLALESGDARLARRYFTKALKLVRGPRVEDSVYVDSVRGLRDLAWQENDWQAAIPVAETALQIAEHPQTDDRDRSRVTAAKIHLAHLRLRLGETEVGRGMLTEVVESYGAAPHRDLIGAVDTLARLNSYRGHIDGAAENYLLALQSRQEPLIPEDPEVRRLVTELRELGLRSGREDLVAQAQQLFSTHGIDPIDEVFDPSRIWKTGDVGIKPPVAHTEVRPNFPERARRMGHAGVVIVEVLVALDGTARPYQISHSSTPNVGFEEEALRVAAEWRFYPAVQFGVPVVSQHLLVLDFGGWSAKRTEGLRH